MFNFEVDIKILLSTPSFDVDGTNVKMAGVLLPMSEKADSIINLKTPLCSDVSLNVPSMLHHISQMADIDIWYRIWSNFTLWQLVTALAHQCSAHHNMCGGIPCPYQRATSTNVSLQSGPISTAQPPPENFL